MDVNRLVHTAATPNRSQRVSLRSISDIFVDLPSALPIYPPPEQRNYYLGSNNQLPALVSAPGSRESLLPPHTGNPLDSSLLASYHHGPTPISNSVNASNGSTFPHNATRGAASLGHSPPHLHRHPIATPVMSASTVSPGNSSPNSTVSSPPSASNSNSLTKRKTRNNLPKETTYTLLKWLNEHLNHPYPNSFEKNQLMHLTGLNQQQLSNWFINARRRKIKLLKQRESV